MQISRLALISMLFLTPAAEAATVPVIVQGTPQTAPDRTITMTGTGIVKAMPDTAIISGGVITRAKRSADALRANGEAMAKAVTAAKALGLTDKQITTAAVSFEPQYETDSKGNIDPDRRIVAYIVSNRIVVTLNEKIERAGEVLDALLQNGANDSAGVSFEIRDVEALEMQARAEAAKNALTRAQAYCRPIGAELGAVRSVREGSGGAVFTDQIMAEDIGRSPDKNLAESLQRIPGVPITRVEAREQTITETVTIVWALK